MAREDISLLEALREDLGVRSVKDGCSPQGQCGCCTVLVDGAPRVSCVTPVRRVAGRAVGTVDGLPAETRDSLIDAFVAHGASQCGFCTPGILCRLAALPESPAPAAVESALLAHLCRCTGWRSIVDAATGTGGPGRPGTVDEAAASARAALEGGAAQSIGAEVVLGRGGFADDTAPPGCLVAVPVAGASTAALLTADGWSVGATLAEARAGAGKVQGRRSGLAVTHPVDVPPGDWDMTLQTTWLEPAYLEPDASWCEPGGVPASAVAQGGAFGGKTHSVAPEAARLLAGHLGRPVRVQYSREDVVRHGPKRPPVGAGARQDGTGIIRLGITGAHQLDPSTLDVPAGFEVETVPVTGPAVSTALRGAGWAEAAVLVAVASARREGTDRVTVAGPDGGAASARVEVGPDGWPVAVSVDVDAGDPLDPTVLVSYVQGAAHMGLGWVCSEGMAVDEAGEPTDLTIRSFGVLRARDTPTIHVSLVGEGGPPVRASDAVMAAVAGATWLAQDLPSQWPTMRGTRR